MIIYLDCDGVIADWVEQVHFYTDTPRQNWQAWDDFKRLGISQASLDDAMSLVTFWKEMPLLPGAKELLAGLEATTKARRYICTRPYEHPNCLFGRSLWLKSNFNISISETIYMHDKWLLAHGASILIDDNEGNCELFRQMGGHAILYPQSYNTKVMPKNKTNFVLDEVAKIMGKSHG